MIASSSVSDIRYWCPDCLSRGSSSRLAVCHWPAVPLHVTVPSGARMRWRAGLSWTLRNSSDVGAAPISTLGWRSSRKTALMLAFARSSNIDRSHPTASREVRTSRMLGPHSGQLVGSPAPFQSCLRGCLIIGACRSSCAAAGTSTTCHRITKFAGICVTAARLVQRPNYPHRQSQT